jgi:hypothetical protein
MKLPPWQQIVRRVAVLLLVVLLTFGWAARHPKTVERLRGIVAPSFTAPPERWALELSQRFNDCGHQETAISGYRSEAKLKAAAEKHADYRLEGVTENRYRYWVELPGFCSLCRTQRFLGLLDGEVVIFRGTPSQPGPVVEKASIPMSLLPEQELGDLKKGIPFKDNREKLLLLEGLHEHVR